MSTLVCDASAVAAALLDAGPDGNWAAGVLANAELLAPSVVAFETANVIRRQETAGVIGSDLAAQAHAELLDLAIEQWPYELLAPRAWELRANLPSYDASNVALAELTGAPLATLDLRVTRAPGAWCAFVTPPLTPPASPAAPGSR
jgi:predicted nucleic acid-binding protein